MYNLSYLFLLFMMYSILGWFVESIYSCYTFYDKKFVNRGFLIGPYCPIYGIGVLLIIYFLNDYINNPLVLFILAMVICMLLEYITSYLMERIFNARWWDYSDKKFNINGRICLETAIPFGLLGILVMYIINPFFNGILSKLNNNLIIILGILLFIVFITDLIISFTVILKFRNVDISTFKDDTEEISKRVREYLENHSILTKRLIESFPNAKIRIEKFKERMDKIKKKHVS